VATWASLPTARNPPYWRDRRTISRQFSSLPLRVYTKELLFTSSAFPSRAAASATLGVGIAQIPDALALPGLRDGTLRPILLDSVASAPSLKVVYPSNRFLTAKVRAFSDFVAEVFPSDGWWPEIAAMAPVVSERLR